MSRGPWGDPAVEHGFAAAYAPAQERRHVDVQAEDVQAQGVQADGTPAEGAPALGMSVEGGPARVAPLQGMQPTPQDEADEAADAAARPLTRDGRRVRAPQPGRLSPQRAVAGAAVSVAGVLLGIGTLLWLSDDPSDGVGPVVQEPPAVAAPELATQPESEQVPVDPPAPAAPPVVAVAPPAPPPARPAAALVPVIVLNNSRIEGLADTAAEVFRDGGWPVARTGNFRGKIPSTTVYYEDGQQAAARAFAARFDEVVRVRPRFATLPARGLVVVVTRDFRG